MEFKTQKGTVLPLLKLKGKDYLAVQQRVRWFREEHPDWSIITEFVILDPTCAMAKATVIDDKAVTLATAHKFEDKQGFADFREKAETGAIGRALAHCGYGTQFASELDEGERIVDSPMHSMRNEQPPEPPPEYMGYPPYQNGLDIELGEPSVGMGSLKPSGMDHYVFPVGKYKGRTLKDIGAADLRKIVEYWGKQAEAPSGLLLDGLNNVKRYLESLR